MHGSRSLHMLAAVHAGQHPDSHCLVQALLLDLHLLACCHCLQCQCLWKKRMRPLRDLQAIKHIQVAFRSVLVQRMMCVYLELHAVHVWYAYKYVQLYVCFCSCAYVLQLRRQADLKLASLVACRTMDYPHKDHPCNKSVQGLMQQQTRVVWLVPQLALQQRLIISQ